MWLARFSKRVDWFTVVGIFAVIMLVGLTAAITMRFNARKRLRNQDYNNRYTTRYLPVARIKRDGAGKITTKDMALNPSQFTLFVSIYKEVYSTMRVQMCTDDTSWSHFSLLVAAEAYKRLEESSNHDDDQEDISEFIAKCVEDTIEPYLMLLASKTSGEVDVDRLEEELEECLKVENIRGVPGRDIPPISSKVKIIKV